MTVNMSFLQDEIRTWARRNFPDDTLVDKGLGLAEEAGEVCRAILKDRQHLRGTHEEWMSELKNELGDVLIQAFLTAELAGFDLETCLIDRWHIIQNRDWIADPKGHGLPATPQEPIGDYLSQLDNSSKKEEATDV